MLGINVNNIAEFLPSSIPNLVCWIRAEKGLTRSKTIGEYASQLTDMNQRNKLIQQYRNDLSKVVITEIISDTPGAVNTFVRKEEVSTAFPELQEFPEKISSFNISNYVDPSTQQIQTIHLISNFEIDLPENFSYFTNWNGNIKVEFSKTTRKILIYSNLVQNPPTINLNGNVYVQPTAELMELIIYSRELELAEKQTLEGYIAYKRNEQYNLPINHPYLPDLTPTEISFVQIHTNLKTMEESLQAGLYEIEALYQKYKMYNGIIDEHDLQKQLAITALNEMRELRLELSKGALFSRKEKAIQTNAVYRAITEHKWDKNQVFNKNTLQTYVSIFQRANTILQAYLNKLRNFNTGNSIPLRAMRGGGDTPNPEAVNFYTKLHAADTDVKLDGNDAYNSLQTNHVNKVNNMLEIIREHSSSELLYFETLKAKPWVSITNPKYKFVEAYKANIVEYLTTGDYAYLIRLLQQYNALASNIAKGYLLHKSHVIFTETYVGFLEYIHRICTNYIREIGIIKARIEICLEQYAAVNHPEIEVPALEPVTLTPMQYITRITKHYLCPVTQEDRNLFHFEYIEVTDAGTPVRDEKMGIILFFPSKMDIVHTATGFLFNGREEYIILKEFGSSVIQYMNEKYKPSYHKTDGSELNRMNKNSICAVSSPINTLILPTYGLIPGDFFMVYNISGTAICALNSGKIQLRTLIGPRDTLLFIYTGGDMPYGYISWSTNYLPYDTLFDAPRSNISSYIPELKTEIYVKETGIQGKFFEPIYDDAWNFVEVRRWNDGKVYDIDDVNHVNPHDVIQGVNQSINTLLLHPATTKNFHTMGKISVIKDSSTGVPLLCSSKGVIVPNEFGYAKSAQTPLIYVGGEIKIRGAYEDIVLIQGHMSLIRTYPIAPYLTHILLFTTEFIRPVIGSTLSIYVTMNHFPIISADGKFLEIDPTFVTTQAIGAPYELNGVSTQPYNPIDIPSIAHTEEVAWNQARITEHFENGTQFLQELIQDLERRSIKINALGDTAQATIISMNTLSAQIRVDIGSITPETINAKLDTYANSYKNLMNEVVPLIAHVEQGKEYEYNMKYLEKDGLEKISQYITQIRGVEQNISSRTGMTQVQAIHRLLQVAETEQKNFLVTIHKIRNQIDKHIYDDVDHLVGEAKARLLAVERIATTDLLNGVKEAGREYCQVLLTSIRNMHADLMSQYRFAKKIALWLGVDSIEQPAYNQLVPVKSTHMNMDIYTQYDNPLFMRDWANVPNIQADLLKQQAISVLSLLHNLPVYEGQENVQYLHDIQESYNRIKKSVQEPINALQNGVIYAYGVIHTASIQLQTDNQKVLENKVNTINSCIQRIDGKLNALQTLQMKPGSDMTHYYNMKTQYEALKSQNTDTLLHNISNQRLDQMTLNMIISNMDRYWNSLLQIETAMLNA